VDGQVAARTDQCRADSLTLRRRRDREHAELGLVGAGKLGVRRSGQCEEHPAHDVAPGVDGDQNRALAGPAGDVRQVLGVVSGLLELTVRAIGGDSEPTDRLEVGRFGGSDHHHTGASGRLCRSL
jgi:hypothetical protein